MCGHPCPCLPDETGSERHAGWCTRVSAALGPWLPTAVFSPWKCHQPGTQKRDRKRDCWEVLEGECGNWDPLSWRSDSVCRDEPAGFPHALLETSFPTPSIPVPDPLPTSCISHGHGDAGVEGLSPQGAGRERRLHRGCGTGSGGTSDSPFLPLRTSAEWKLVDGHRQ